MKALDHLMQRGEHMGLDHHQLDAYERSGLLLLPDAFAPQEVERLRRAFEEDSEIPGPHRIAEDDGRSVRAIYASHLRHPLFDWLVRCERILGVAQQLTASELYVWQFKINTKRPFGGAAWCWHQDYVVWREFDGLPAPDAVSAAVFLDDVTEFNGPIVFVPASHRAGVIEPPPREAGPKSAQHVDPVDFEIANEDVAKLVSRHGIAAPKGSAGSVLFFHPNIVHASGMNISPFGRDLLILTYNPLRNAPSPEHEPRAQYLVGSASGSLDLADTLMPA